MDFNTAKKLIFTINIAFLSISMFGCKPKCQCEELTNGGDFSQDKKGYFHWQMDSTYTMTYDFDNNKNLRFIAVYSKINEKGVQLIFLGEKLEVISQTGFKPNRSIDVDSLSNNYIKTY